MKHVIPRKPVGTVVFVIVTIMYLGGIYHLAKKPHGPKYIILSLLKGLLFVFYQLILSKFISFYQIIGNSKK